MASVPVWYVREHAGDIGRLSAYLSDRFPDGTLVEAADVAGIDMSSDPGTWTATYEWRRRDLLTVQPNVGPPMWFVEDHETAADPPTVVAIAFPTHHFAPGMVVTNDEFEGMPVHPDDQVGAIRWWPSTGQIKEFYVQPERRRQGIGQALIWVAAAHQIASGGPPVWGGGDRTDLGEAFAAAQKTQQRVAPRRSVVAPMTPEEKRAGVPNRNLFPDT